MIKFITVFVELCIIYQTVADITEGERSSFSLSIRNNSRHWTELFCT